MHPGERSQTSQPRWMVFPSDSSVSSVVPKFLLTLMKTFGDDVMVSGRGKVPSNSQIISQTPGLSRDNRDQPSRLSRLNPSSISGASWLLIIPETRRYRTRLNDLLVSHRCRNVSSLTDFYTLFLHLDLKSVPVLSLSDGYEDVRAGRPGWLVPQQPF